MEFQVLFNSAMGALLLLGGWFMRIMWDSLQGLQKQDRELAHRETVRQTRSH
jgi:hypothetical protein